jgi:hypothetical protein
MHQQLVKLTSKGKVNIVISKNIKALLKHILEQSINDWKPESLFKLSTAITSLRYCLAQEIYTKYFAELHVVNRDSKLVLTRAQATSLWVLSQEYDQDAYSNAEMGAMLLQLHQKLS